MFEIYRYGFESAMFEIYRFVMSQCKSNSGGSGPVAGFVNAVLDLRAM
jgi:hypothetical protein